MVNFSWRNDDDAVGHTDDRSGGADDHTRKDWSWFERWHGSLWLVDDAETLSTTSSEQLRGCAVVDTGCTNSMASIHATALLQIDRLAGASTLRVARLIKSPNR
eukprot:4941827-Lingulodinium_polyedra.AAC.1